MTRTVLFVSHVNPARSAAGNEVRIRRLIAWLRESGYRVVYLLNAPALEVAERRGLESLVDELRLAGPDPAAGVGTPPASLRERFLAGLAHRTGSPLLKQRLASRDLKAALAPARLRAMTVDLCGHVRPCAVVAEYVFAAPCLVGVPREILRIIDTHDLFSAKGKGETLHCTPREERDLLLNGDVIMAIQPEEAGRFSRLVPERTVITVAVDCEPAAAIIPERTVAGTVLMVGSDNPANCAGLREFHAQAWPLIRQACPEARLRVAGRVAAALENPGDGVEPVGWVDNPDAEYERAAVVINPTTYGTGLKIKTVEALCRGAALVTTPNGGEGVASPAELPCLVASDWPAFAAAVIQLLQDDARRLDQQRRALDFARQRYARETVYAPLARLLEGAAGQQEPHQ